MLPSTSLAEIEAGAALSALLLSALTDCESDEECESLIDEECDKWVRRGVISPATAAAVSDVLLNG
jgi:hypothetical protein